MSKVAIIKTTLQTLLEGIQKEFHNGMFTVMDGAKAGDGAGSRTHIPVTRNILLASDYCVAIDAVCAKLMGFEPMDHKFIRTAHELGLGTGRIDEIEIIGDVDAGKEIWGFVTGDNVASRVSRTFWFKPMRWLQKLMFHTPFVYVFILASAIYHDKLWYLTCGKKIVNRWLEESLWGRLVADYQAGKFKI